MLSDERPPGILHRLKRKTKSKTWKFLSSSTANEEVANEDADALEELENSPAFNSSKYLKSARNESTRIPEKTSSLLQETAKIIKNPKDAITHHATRKAAGKLAKSRPMVSRKADLDFLVAHDEMESARARLGREDPDAASVDRENIEVCAQRIQEMEESRMKTKVAWVTSRHIHRARVVTTTPPPFPKDEFFEEDDEFGFRKFNWPKWIAYKVLHISHPFTAQYVDDFDKLPYDKETLCLVLERFIIVSAPMQIFLADIRQVYRWEDPYRTGKWLLVYSFFWYISHITTFFTGLIIYFTLWKFCHPSPVHEIRAAVDRSSDNKVSALKIEELMDRHGSHDWLIPLLEPAGPHLQVQILDLANFFEALYNFYTFRNPPATFASLTLLGAYFILSLFSNSEFILKFFWFTVGFDFFALWPISSLYPRYRLLVSPTKWALWDIPTQAELCFQYLQERSAVVEGTLLSPPPPNLETTDPYDSDTSNDSFQTATSEQLNEKDIIAFKCTLFHTPGHLTITTSSIRFTSSNPLSNPTFERPFSDLLEISKRQADSSTWNPLLKMKVGVDGLELKFRSQPIFNLVGRGGNKLQVEDEGVFGQESRMDTIFLENMRGRDKAFNALIGFSGLRWQHLQKVMDVEIS